MASDTDRKQLLDWYRRIKRDLPWRRTRDPYRIWISEIMLQQTRVDQALPYYERFTERYPDVTSLARSDLDEVLRLWEGLGYYSRARNMHKAAKQIVEMHNGRFPDTYDEVISLQGIGPYTAAAIMSIAFGEPHPVVDGNVIRVISRLYGIREDVRLSLTQKEIERHAAALLDRSSPGDFNQAMMELGATVCTPKSPSCSSCPFQLRCHAHRNGETGKYPYKSPAKKRPHHEIAVGVVRDERGRMLIARRPESAMLGGLWEFPGGKQEDGETLVDTVRRELREELGINVGVDLRPFQSVRHAYSHFTITLHAFQATLEPGSTPPVAQNGEPIRWVAAEELVDYAFPKANRKITETLMKAGKWAGTGKKGANTTARKTAKATARKTAKATARKTAKATGHKLLPVPDNQLSSLREFLDPIVRMVEEPGYIASDPVAFMHRYEESEDSNLAGFLAALMAWGRRDIVMAKVGNLLERFDTNPADFIGNLSARDEQRLEGFRHRTFTADDVRWLLRALSRILQQHGSFEQFWVQCYKKAGSGPINPVSRAPDQPDSDVKSNPGADPARMDRIVAGLFSEFHDGFFALIPDAPARVRKHLATPVKNSSCKRLWLYLRWTLRPASCVDPGTMSFMPASELMIPLDVHVARYSRLFGLLTRQANDWKAVTELTARLRLMDASDPAKYDYALFGLGIRDITIPGEFIINTPDKNSP